MKTIYGVCLFIALLNYNCKPDLIYQAAAFTDTLQQEVTLLNDTFIMDVVEGIFTYKEYLIVNAMVNDFHFHIFSKHNGQYIKSFGMIGRGPGEIVRTGPKNLNPKMETS